MFVSVQSFGHKKPIVTERQPIKSDRDLGDGQIVATFAGNAVKRQIAVGAANSELWISAATAAD